MKLKERKFLIVCKMNKRIKAIIFDVGGVIFSPRDKKRNLLSSFREACFLLKGVDIDFKRDYGSIREIYLESSANKISKSKTLELLSKKFKIPSDRIEIAFLEVYKNNILENRKLYNFILKLKEAGYKIGISSIQFHLSKDILIPEKFYKDFDALQISCEDGFRKPDPHAFQSILKKLDVNPDEAVFIDDGQKNVEAAKNLGIHAIIFKNNNQLFKQLEKLGVKIK